MSLRKLTRSQIAAWLPARPASAHKGSFGRVLVIAGSREMCGAGLLCAKSALTAGAGLVFWALPKTMQPSFAAALPEVITWPLAENASGEIAVSAWKQLLEYAVRFQPTVTVIGCGMGKSPLLRRLLEQWPTPVVLDADALNRLAAEKKLSWPSARASVITPHAAEMARLLDTVPASTEEERREQVYRAVSYTGGTVLLKGPRTLVAAEDEKCCPAVWQNTTGNVALAKGGSGDVLAGLIAGFWAQTGSNKKTALQAACCGAYVHGLAGEKAAKTRTNYGVLATDIIQAVPLALKQILDK